MSNTHSWLSGPVADGSSILFITDSEKDYAASIPSVLTLDSSALYIHFQPYTRIMHQVPTATIAIRDSFEDIIMEIQEQLKTCSPGQVIVFDPASRLSDSYFSDRMIGNYFILVSQMISRYRLRGCFCLRKNFHSFHTHTPAADSVTIIIETFSNNNNLYFLPRKSMTEGQSLAGRLFHASNGTEITSSFEVSELMASSTWEGLPAASYRMVGVWDKMFMKAERLAVRKDKSAQQTEMLERIIPLVLTGSPKMQELARRYFTLHDCINIWKRMIGTGQIGGKTFGMLLARRILLAKDEQKWRNILELHDSFFIGSDVFYTYLVQNNCWWAKQSQKDEKLFLADQEQTRQALLAGTFPGYIINRFENLIDYFGDAPFIVRSSSLLEDAYENSFSGKYDSFFIINKGSKQERLENFLNTIRKIYASTMSERALEYRKERGVLHKDEQMALLVQRVSGNPRGKYFYPSIAGVGYSFNPFVWNPRIKPDEGIIRLVYGLGTRAVDRNDDDYTRIVSLSAPLLRPESRPDDQERYNQKKVDALSLPDGSEAAVNTAALFAAEERYVLDFITSRDSVAERHYRQHGIHRQIQTLTFERLLGDSAFPGIMREILTTLRDSYSKNVDIEFTMNFNPPDNFKVHIVQCRPMPVQGIESNPVPLGEISSQKIVMTMHGPVIGHSRIQEIDTVIFVKPEIYRQLNKEEKAELARTVGRFCGQYDNSSVMLLGPGRWGTSSPSLGVPVTFPEIRHAKVLAEIDQLDEELRPDLSLGTHFFNEIVENNMLYLGFQDSGVQNSIQKDFFINNSIAVQHSNRNIQNCLLITERSLLLNANAMTQQAVLYEN